MGTVHAKERSSHRDINYAPNKQTSKEMDGSINSDYYTEGNNVVDREEVEKVKRIDFQSVKARVDKVHIDGLSRTKDDIIKAQVKELFKAKNFQDVILNVYKVRGKLEALGCFKKIGAFIDTSKGPDASPEGVEVTFTVHEMKRLTGSIKTMVGNNEGSVVIGAKAPNLFGRGERLQAEYSHGIKTSTNINISAIKPFVDSQLNTVLTGSIFSTSNDFPWSGYKQKDNGFLLDIALSPYGPGTLKHNFQYEATYRDITAAKLASIAVREQCGPNLKSALRHICSLDKRDESIFPTAGTLIQFSTEVAGLGGDIGFIKNELTLQSNYTPHPYFTFQLGFQSGLLRGISNDMKLNLADSFFLGGPMNIRGFGMRGCGPHHDGYAMGGDVYWATALHLYTPLPFRPGRNSFGDLFRLHGFVNGGNLFNMKFPLSSLKDGEGYKDCLTIFTENVRCSVGVGLAMKLGNVARVELNFVLPLLYERGDVQQQLQFGIGVHYL